jgi:hypothetical protein
LFSVVLSPPYPAADACYYNDYDFYDLTAKKVRRDAGASAPPGCISFKRKKPFVFLLYWNASREMPARALAKATWSEIGYGKGEGQERKRKRKRGKANGEKGKRRSIQSGGKSCTILGFLFGC